MGYILSAMFLIIAILCYLEDYIRKYQKSLFFLVGLVLIFGKRRLFRQIFYGFSML